jgi:hypothetical protein
MLQAIAAISAAERKTEVISGTPGKPDSPAQAAIVAARDPPGNGRRSGRAPAATRGRTLAEH